MKKQKIAYARIFHETHSFSPLNTTLEHFKDRELVMGDEILKHYKNTKTETGALIDFVEINNIECCPILAAAANPSGVVTADTYNYLKTSIIEKLKLLKEIDAIYLSLHGAMVVEGINDVEGDLLEDVRKYFPETPLGITLDLHGNISRKTVELSNIMVSYKTYPHTDQYETGQKCLNLLLKYMNKEIEPRNYYIKPPLMLPSMNMMTSTGPMADIVNEARRLETSNNVFNISVFGGYPYSDVEDVGFSIVVTSNKNYGSPSSILEELSQMAWQKRHEFIIKLPSAEEAVEEALIADEKTVALVDVSDNPGSGGFADTTLLLKTMLLKQVNNAAFAFISDAEAVEKAVNAGVGSSIALELGGKVSSFYGDPVTIKGVVRTISDGIYYNKGPWNTGIKVNFGRTVVISTEGIDILVSEGCQSPNDPEVFRRNGLEPTSYKILALKAKNHFRVGFKDIVTRVIPLDAPGIASLDLQNFSYKNVPRPIFPLDID